MDPSSINSQIQIAFQATQLILVFITVLFGLRYDQIQKGIKEHIPDGKSAKKSLEDKLVKNFLINCLPLIIIIGTAFYLFFPLFCKIIITSHLELWNFDLGRTSFALIEVYIFLFLVWSCILTFKLLKRIWLLKK